MIVLLPPRFFTWFWRKACGQLPILGIAFEKFGYGTSK